MQLLNVLQGLKPSGAGLDIAPGELSKGGAKTRQSGFADLVTRFTEATPDAEAAAGNLPLMTAALQAGLGGEAEVGKGQILPLQRQALAALEGEDGGEEEGLLSRLLGKFGVGEADADAADLLAELDQTLDEVTSTIEQLLGVEPANSDVTATVDTGEETPRLVIDPDARAELSELLQDELGLNQARTETVLQALDDWVENPPSVALLPQQLDQAGPEAKQRVEEMTALLDGLGAELAGWRQALASPNAADRLVADGERPLLQELRTLAGFSGEADQSGDKGVSPAVVVARMLQSIQNTAASGSLPQTLDLSRPEATLLTTQSVQPSQDVAFSASLANMALARQPQSGPGASEREFRSLTSAPAPAPAVSEAPQGPTLNLSVGQQPNEAQTLSLQRVDRPMMTADTGRQLGERIQMMAQGDIKQASIRLDPPELGALDIRVTVQNDQTQVQIISANPQVREALESQSVRLREILEQQGLNLSDLDVRDEGRDSGQEGDQGGTGDGEAAADGQAAADTGEVPEGQSTGTVNLVDHFV